MKKNTDMMNDARLIDVEPEERVDLIGRQTFVKEVVQIITSYAEFEKPACYAINGVWGSGKTFVLNLLERELKKISENETNQRKYLVLRYNCWEYDYYDEPLLSIVATMQRAVQNAQGSAKLKGVVKAVLDNAVDQLGQIAGLLLDVATNGLSTKLIEFGKRVKAELDEKQEAAQKFDDNLLVLKAVQGLRDVMKNLSEKLTVVFLVDELDRCLPEYAIRVLERLHHIYVDEEPTKNVQVIFSVDRQQLEHVVKQLYGEKTDAASYLQKFISFEINLDTGSLNQRFDEKFKDFIDQFDECPKAEIQDMMAFKARILDGYDIRRRIAFVEKADLVHRIVGKKEIDDYYMLCVALFLTVFSAWAKDIYNKEELQNITAEAHTGAVLMPSHVCFKKLSDIYMENQTRDGKEMIYRREYTRFFIEDHSLYGAILCAYRTVLGVSPNINQDDSFFPIISYADEAWKLLLRLQ